MHLQQYGRVDRCSVEGGSFGPDRPCFCFRAIFEVLRSKVGAGKSAFKVDETSFWSLVIPVLVMQQVCGGRGQAMHVLSTQQNNRVAVFVNYR